MVNINPICTRQFKGEIIYVVYSILSYVREKQKPGLYLQQAGNKATTLNPQLFYEQIDKKIPFGKMNR